MPISNAHANDLLDTDFAGSVYLALHTSSPGPQADVSTELVGLGYARAEVDQWTAAASRSVLNAEAVSFTSLPAATITHYSLWNAVSGGKMLYFGALDDPVTVQANGGFDIPVNDVSVTLT